MTPEFQREYLMRLPLPLAQLYSRAFNAKDQRARHDNTFYLFEALVKLAATVSAAAYLHEVQQGAERVEGLDRALAHLALPSLGQWVGLLRDLARSFGRRPDAASHPLGHLGRQLESRRRDLPAVAALYRRIKNGPDGEPAGDQSCSLLQLVEALVQYRNGVFGHGAGRFESFYGEEMGPLLFPAANEVLVEGVFDLLGPPGSRLVYLTEVRTTAESRVEVGLRELVGLQGERLTPLVLNPAQAAGLLPNQVAVVWPGRPVPLRLDPLLVYRESELAEEVLFLNRARDNRQAEYLSYTTGRTERDRATAPALAALLSAVINRPVGEEDLQPLADRSVAETLSGETPSSPGGPGGPQAGDYTILAELGRGGMGVVYLARQLSLGRLVALKMLPADVLGDEPTLARFRREIRTLARCEHPHIVKVLSSGTMPDGQPYYTMEYVPGCNLELVWRALAGAGLPGSISDLTDRHWADAVFTACCKHREQTLSRPGAAGDGEVSDLAAPPEPPAGAADAGGLVRRVVALVRDAALALQAVHDQGVVHRDVTPANLMLTPDGSRLVLMDFGLAKGQGQTLSRSRAGGLLGTLRYAAPEQLAAAKLTVGPAADVRGLGVVCWELLTRRRLYAEAEDEARLATLIYDEDVPRLRQLDPGFDRDLEAVVGRATERRVADRIKSARQLAEYLELYLEGRPLPIRPPTVAELARRWAGRHKALVNFLAATVLLVCLGGWWYSLNLRETRAAALVETLTAAEIADVPKLIEGLKPYSRWAIPLLEEKLEAEAATEKQRLHAALALEALVSGQGPYLHERLLTADLHEVPVLRDALLPRRAEVVQPLWSLLEDPRAPKPGRFRAGLALATLDGPDPGENPRRWQRQADFLLDQFLAAALANPSHYGPLLEALRPVRIPLLGPLVRAFPDGKRPESERRLATSILKEYAADRPDVLAELVAEADAGQYEVLRPLLPRYRDRLLGFLKQELDRTPRPDEKGSALDARWAAPREDLVRALDAGHGMMAERFALCQTLALGRYAEVAQGMERCGFRPVRFRPYADGDTVRVAAVWVRDGRKVQLVYGRSREELWDQDEEWRSRGYLPVDVAGYLDASAGKPVERYAALWGEPEVRGETARMYVGESEADHEAARQTCREAGLIPQTCHVMTGTDGKPRYSFVWKKPVGVPTSFEEAFALEEGIYAGKGEAGQVQVDVSLEGRPAPMRTADESGAARGHFTAVWLDGSEVEARESHGLEPGPHVGQCRRLAEDGFGPVAISVIRLAGATPGGGAGPLVTASVWHRPVVPESVRDALARRQANAALTLLHLGEPERLWTLLEHGKDPRLRTYLIHRFAPYGVDPHTLVQKLMAGGNVAVRRALILVLGEYGGGALKLGERAALVDKLLSAYCNDPDPGIHSAAEWLLRRWGQVDRLRDADEALSVRGSGPDSRWHVNGRLQTFVEIPGPVTFRMGSPGHETDRESGETWQLVRIGHSFAIATKEVTVEQFQEFLRYNKNTGFTFNGRWSPEPDCPVVGVTWRQAVLYCDWLGKREKRPYRLPTEAEWEYACRAGAFTPRHYGHDEELLTRYSWYHPAARRRTWPVGTLKPNDFGLFDMYGNAEEWCQEGTWVSARDVGGPVENVDPEPIPAPAPVAGAGEGQGANMPRADKRPRPGAGVAEAPGAGQHLANGVARTLGLQVVRGGSFNDLARQGRSAFRRSLPPHEGPYTVGFRVAYTVEPAAFPTPPMLEPGGEPLKKLEPGGEPMKKTAPADEMKKTDRTPPGGPSPRLAARK
jgi:formylglycine-generating enzyme required for sulfatase activity/serine/threonine protein kinase